MRELFERFVARNGRLPTEVDPDYLEIVKMSKYRIVDVPDFQPGKCGNCGASKNDGRKYIDFGLQVDWYGTVYLCGHCLEDIANSMGLFDKIKAQVEELQNNSNNFEELQEEGARLHETVVKTFKELEEHYVSLYSSGNNNDSDDDSDLGLTEAATVEQTAVNVQPAANATKSRVTKSTASSGRKDLPSLADLLKSES